MPGMIECFLFCMFVLVEMVAFRWIHVAFLWRGVCSYMYFDIIMFSMMIFIILYMGRFMIVVVFLCLSKELHCVGNREGILHFYMYYQPVVCNICVVKKMWQSVILNIYIYICIIIVCVWEVSNICMVRKVCV